MIPERFKAYACADYFDSKRFAAGHHDETAHLTTFYAAVDVAERLDSSFLAVGRPGVDGIEWGYRRGKPGLWAYYPITGEFKYLAPTVAALFEGWYSGRIYRLRLFATPTFLPINRRTSLATSAAPPHIP